MIVSELITKLHSFKPETVVLIDDTELGFGEITVSDKGIYKRPTTHTTEYYHNDDHIYADSIFVCRAVILEVVSLFPTEVKQ